MEATRAPGTGVPDEERQGRIGVIVVDADPLARRHIVETLRSGKFTIVAEARGGVEGLELATHYRPDIVLAAAGLPGVDGVELARRLATAAPGVKSVVLTVASDDELALRALRNGADGVLAKDIQATGLRRALEGVLAGEIAISRRLTTQLVERIRGLPELGRGLRPVRSSLTTREWEVLDLISGGASNRDIADTLVVSDETVASHLKNIRRKLGVSSREELVRAAQELLASSTSSG